jgi:hypothetical protein
MEENSMSLLSDALEDCVLLNKTIQLDTYGGFVPQYTEGAHFQAAITFDTSIEAMSAAQQGVTSLYTVTTRRNIILDYHMVFKRTRDNKIFRVTSDGSDNKTPKSAGLDMRQVRAEEWSIENDG